VESIKAEEYENNPVLAEEVDPDNELKSFLINHVGNKIQPEDNNVTVEMIVETMAEEFPEFILVLAEENWIRGYEQALSDVDTGRKIVEENEGLGVKKKSCKLCEEQE